MKLKRDSMPPEAAKYKEINCKSVLGTFEMLKTQFWTSYCFDPYNNCEFNCMYCHTSAQKYEGSRDFSVPVYAKTNAPQILAKELSAFKRKGVVRLSLSTDPYQPAEKKYQITRQLLQVLNENGSAFCYRHQIRPCSTRHRPPRRGHKEILVLRCRNHHNPRRRISQNFRAKCGAPQKAS